MSATAEDLRLDHLGALQAEAVHVMREVAAEFERPVLLFSGGKDSIVLLRLAEKAFRPARFPFPLLHVDTGHNFPEVLEFRDRRVAELGEELIVARVQDSIDAGRVHEERGANPSRNRLQTVTLLDALAEHGFDAAFGGARRDEERSRAKERMLSFRDELGQWDPRAQRRELWDLFNTVVNRGESVRAFPLSNWTELDVWRYIAAEQLAVPSIYFAHEREVFERDALLLAVSPFLEPRAGEPVSRRHGALPDGRRHDRHGRGRIDGRRRRGDPARDGGHARHRARPDARRRSDVGGVDGGPQARGVLLVAAHGELVRIATAGSVDDGKSTLIGRLLLDSKQLHDDQVQALDGRELAHFTDGLRAEREQGITIDVAYRFFATPARSFILADTPGHLRYTRNMVTGASTADLALILVDARHGLVQQSRRHMHLSTLLGIRHLVLCVNKMDLVAWDAQRFRAIEADFGALAGRLGVADAAAIPVSALQGGNVVERAAGAPWYDGPTVLEHLETVEIARDRNLDEVRFPVQWIVRTGDYRGYAGRVAGGVLRPGDEVVVLPQRVRTRIESIDSYDGPLERAFPPMSVTLRLGDQLDIGRGDLLAGPDDPPLAARELTATVCWMAEEPARPGHRYLLKHTTRRVRATVEAIEARIDVDTAEPAPAAELALNDIGDVRLRTSAPILADAYAENRATGAFILIDELTHDTVARGMVRSTSTGTRTAEQRSPDVRWHDGELDRGERWSALGQAGATVWLTGLPASGKSTIAAALERRLVHAGRVAYLLDGDNVRHGLSGDLGFDAASRSENIRRVGHVARLFADAGGVALVSLVSPFREDRLAVRRLHDAAGLPFVEVFVDTPLEECARRDPKGLYAKARAGRLAGLTGDGAPYEAPQSPELVVRTTDASVEDAVAQVLALLPEAVRR